MAACLESSPSLPLQPGWKGEKIQVWVVRPRKTPESHFGQTFDLGVKAKLVECDEYQAKLGAVITIKAQLGECTLAKARKTRAETAQTMANSESYRSSRQLQTVKTFADCQDICSQS